MGTAEARAGPGSSLLFLGMLGVDSRAIGLETGAWIGMEGPTEEVRRLGCGVVPESNSLQGLGALPMFAVEVENHPAPPPMGLPPTSCPPHCTGPLTWGFGGRAEDPGAR